MRPRRSKRWAEAQQSSEKRRPCLEEKTTQPFGRRRMSLAVPAADVSAGKGGARNKRPHAWHNSFSVYTALEESTTPGKITGPRITTTKTSPHRDAVHDHWRTMAVPVVRPRNGEPTSLATKRKKQVPAVRSTDRLSEDGVFPFLVFFVSSPLSFPLSRLSETRPPLPA